MNKEESHFAAKCLLSLATLSRLFLADLNILVGTALGQLYSPRVESFSRSIPPWLATSIDCRSGWCVAKANPIEIHYWQSISVARQLVVPGWPSNPPLL